MCGIAGIYQGVERQPVAQAIARISHRGPDGQGVWSGPDGVLGHARLAIIDPAYGQQPMEYDGAVICFNGEIYNYRSLRDQYLRGENLETNSDTEVLLRLYRLFGPSCVTLLDGMFAFGILDRGELFLARDPLGIKPLYITPQASPHMFASELKALLSVADAATALQPGTWYHSRLGTHRYYTIGQGWPLAGMFQKPADALPPIRSVLRSAVQKRLLADVPIGISLSGGLDSSIIALLASQETNGRIETFAVGVKGSPDLYAANQMAYFLGTRHHEYVYTQEEMEKVLPEVVYLLESADPALVRSAIPNYFLARLASEHVKVILTGEGADELYAGYDYMRAIRDADILQKELILTLGELHRSNLQRADRMFMAFGVEGRVPFLDTESVALALSLPAAWKLIADGDQTKQLLRHAFEDSLPHGIVHRPKQKFSSGAGSAQIFANLAEEMIDMATFQREQQRLQAEWGYRLTNKEALYYLFMLRGQIPESWVLPGMGISRSL